MNKLKGHFVKSSNDNSFDLYITSNDIEDEQIQKFPYFCYCVNLDDMTAQKIEFNTYEKESKYIFQNLEILNINRFLKKIKFEFDDSTYKLVEQEIFNNI